MRKKIKYDLLTIRLYVDISRKEGDFTSGSNDVAEHWRTANGPHTCEMQLCTHNSNDLRIFRDIQCLLLCLSLMANLLCSRR